MLRLKGIMLSVARDVDPAIAIRPSTNLLTALTQQRLFIFLNLLAHLDLQEGIGNASNIILCQKAASHHVMQHFA